MFELTNDLRSRIEFVPIRIAPTSFACPWREKRASEGCVDEHESLVCVDEGHVGLQSLFVASEIKTSVLSLDDSHIGEGVETCQIESMLAVDHDDEVGFGVQCVLAEECEVGRCFVGFMVGVYDQVWGLVHVLVFLFFFFYFQSSLLCKYFRWRR